MCVNVHCTFVQGKQRYKNGKYWEIGVELKWNEVWPSIDISWVKGYLYAVNFAS